MKTIKLVQTHRQYIAELFDIMESSDNKTIDVFTKELNNLDFINKTSDDIDKIKGDIWEIFGELFFSIIKTESFIYHKYDILRDYDDYGVDATALNIYNKKSVIQYKYRSNQFDKEHHPKYADMAKARDQATFDLKYDIKEQDTLVLFTNCYNYSYKIKERYNDIVKIFSAKEINHYISNIDSFWVLCVDILMKVF